MEESRDKAINKYKTALEESFATLRKYEQFYSVNKFGPGLDFENRTTYESYTEDTYNGVFEVKLVTKCLFYKMKCEIVFNVYDKENGDRLELIVIDEDVGQLREINFLASHHFRNRDECPYSPIPDTIIRVKGKKNGIEFDKPRKLTIKYSYNDLLFKFGGCLGSNEFDLKIPISSLTDILDKYTQKLKNTNSAFDKSFDVDKITMLLPYAESTTLVNVPEALRESGAMKIVNVDKYMDEDILNIKLYPLCVVVKIATDENTHMLYLPNQLSVLEEDLRKIKSLYKRYPNIDYHLLDCYSVNFHRNISEYGTYPKISVTDRRIIKAMEVTIRMLNDRIKRCIKADNVFWYCV